VSREDAGARLDVLVAKLLEDLSRSQARRLIDEGLVTVAGRAEKPSCRVNDGDEIVVVVPPATPIEALPEDLALDIVYEDASVVVVHKAAGMVVHPAPGAMTGTLVHALLFHCRDLAGIGGALRPGIVHRIDRGTTGLLVVAKTGEALARLQEQFKAHTIERRYLALARGRLDADRGTVHTLYARHPRSRIKFSGRVRVGRDAVTHFEVRERLGSMTLIELRLETGRTHQIRVHLSEMGHPILGDDLYGDRKLPARTPPALERAIRALDHPMLHAAVLGFDHPRTGERLRFSAPLPADFEALLAIGRANSR
jgi:23S rRNA pseudouridine1911/1915/1917 synthase